MRKFSATVLVVVLGLSLWASLSPAKPDKVDGVTVPSGRIPQVIKNGRYPRTYFPNTERLGKREMRITAVGTGMPNQTPTNAAACFLNRSGFSGDPVT